MEETKNLGLQKPGYDDDSDIVVINQNMDKIDAEVTALNAKIDEEVTTLKYPLPTAQNGTAILAYVLRAIQEGTIIGYFAISNPIDGPYFGTTTLQVNFKKIQGDDWRVTTYQMWSNHISERMLNSYLMKWQNDWSNASTTEPPQELPIPFEGGIIAHQHAYYFRQQDKTTTIAMSFVNRNAAMSHGGRIATIPLGYRPRFNIEIAFDALGAGTGTLLLDTSGFITVYYPAGVPANILCIATFPPYVAAI